MMFQSWSRQAPLLVGFCLMVFAYIVLENSFTAKTRQVLDSPPAQTAQAAAATTTSSSSATCPTPPFRFRAKTNARNKIVQLASYPGSGNTWVRHLIQRGSGQYTGSVYNDESLKSEFPGESVRDARVICVKTHFPCTACWMRGKTQPVPIERFRSGKVAGYAATVQVLRNPFEALLSDFNHKRSGANHTGLASAEELHGTVFADFVLDKMRVWMDHAQEHLVEPDRDASDSDSGVWRDKHGLPVLLVYYDDLRAHTERELARVFAFLNRFSGEPIPDVGFAARCAVSDMQGGFRRVKPSSGNDAARDPFALVLEGTGKTLRQTACEYFTQQRAPFWRTADAATTNWCA